MTPPPPTREPLAEQAGAPERGPGLATGGARLSRAGPRSAEDLLAALRADPELGPRLAHVDRRPARAARLAPPPAGLDERIVSLWRRRGIDELYAHQADAIAAALAGEDVLLATPTASGKTLAYTAPVLQALFETGGEARSLWLFPTKALSQDQSASLNAQIAELGEPWHSFVYDGDTPPPVRRTLRERGHVVLTNPWMLHAGILPHHAKWADLFRSLRYVVIDEVHVLSGVFGSSVANVLRRLARIARSYGADPRFLLSSATLRDAAVHGRRLLGREVRVVDRDGSPAGERTLCVQVPALVDPVAGLRASALEEARALARVLCGPSHQTIFFCNRRTAVEVLTRYLKEAAPRLGLAPEEVRGYRGGYLPLLRREIEAGLRSGEVKVVVATNALELGIDVGALDVAVLVGYPGSQASFWQRVGRAGRRGKASLAVLVARSDPVDRYLASHPEELLGEAREELGLDPDNLVLLSEQLKCAAFELPFDLASVRAGAFGPSPHVGAILDYLASESELPLKRGETYWWVADAYPAADVSLAGGEPDNVLVLDAETTKAIGEVDRASSITTVHEGAIYQVEGETWKVERFDYENRRAFARRVASDYFTEAQSDVELRVLRLEECLARVRPPAGGASEPELDHAIRRGEVHVTTIATLYKKVRFYTRENVGCETIDLPPEEVDTEAVMLTLGAAVAAELGVAGPEGGAAWHGLGALLRRVAPLFVRCQPSDLGISAQVRAPHFGRPTIFLWDRVQGGVGLAPAVFRRHRRMLGAALDVLGTCECRAGCPACVGPPDEVGRRGKRIARAVLGHLLAEPRPVAAAVEVGVAGDGGAPRRGGRG